MVHPGEGGVKTVAWSGTAAKSQRASPAQIRASRLEQIDKELLEAQDRVQQTEPQVPVGGDGLQTMQGPLTGKGYGNGCTDPTHSVRGEQWTSK